MGLSVEKRTAKLIIGGVAAASCLGLWIAWWVSTAPERERANLEKRLTAISTSSRFMNDELSREAARCRGQAAEFGERSSEFHQCMADYLSIEKIDADLAVEHIKEAATIQKRLAELR